MHVRQRKAAAQSGSAKRQRKAAAQSGSACRQRMSPTFQFWGPSRQQAGDLHTLSGRKPRKYKPNTTQYHPHKCVRKSLCKKAARSLHASGPSDSPNGRC